MVIYLYRLFFIKATKAAGQSRLSKFEAVECSKMTTVGLFDVYVVFSH